ncbi:hypothetical protein [Microcystis phage Mwe-JY13]
MTVQAWLIFPGDKAIEVLSLNTESVSIIPRAINNPLANLLGYGLLQANGSKVAPARILNDPDYSGFWSFCSVLQIAVMDSETLFLPEEI